MVPSAWSSRVLALTALVGLADSVYLTVAHYSSTSLACVQTGVVNCDLVTRSSYGLLPGTSVPTSAAGLVWFAILLLLALSADKSTLIGPALLIWCLGGTAFVLYLVYAELRLGHLCEWCTLVHALVVISLLIALGRLSNPGRGQVNAG